MKVDISQKGKMLLQEKPAISLGNISADFVSFHNSNYELSYMLSLVSSCRSCTCRSTQRKPKSI